MSNTWFRLYAEIIDHELVGLLSFEDQRHYVWLLAMKCAGILDKDYPSEKVREAAIARKLGLQGDALCNAKIRLWEMGLIDDDWQPHNWDKRQFVTDRDPTNAERQRRYRHKQKQEVIESNGGVTRYGNETITHQSTDTDTDSSNTSVLLVDRSADADAVAPPAACPHKRIIELYHRHLPTCPAVRSWNGQRPKLLCARWREHPDLAWWDGFLAYCGESAFLTGRVNGSKDRSPFTATLEWLLKPANFQKVHEGIYHR
jgi:hypothetical protein